MPRFRQRTFGMVGHIPAHRADISCRLISKTMARSTSPCSLPSMPQFRCRTFRHVSWSSISQDGRHVVEEDEKAEPSGSRNPARLGPTVSADSWTRIGRLLDTNRTRIRHESDTNRTPSGHDLVGGVPARRRRPVAKGGGGLRGPSGAPRHGSGLGWAWGRSSMPHTA